MDGKADQVKGRAKEAVGSFTVCLSQLIETGFLSCVSLSEATSRWSTRLYLAQDAACRSSASRTCSPDKLYCSAAKRASHPPQESAARSWFDGATGTWVRQVDPNELMDLPL
jgi:hypothetical protein